MLQGLVKSSRTYKISCKFSLIAKAQFGQLPLKTRLLYIHLQQDNNEILVMKVIKK